MMHTLNISGKSITMKKEELLVLLDSCIKYEDVIENKTEHDTYICSSEKCNLQQNITNYNHVNFLPETLQLLQEFADNLNVIHGFELMLDDSSVYMKNINNDVVQRYAKVNIPEFRRRIYQHNYMCNIVGRFLKWW